MNREFFMELLCQEILRHAGLQNQLVVKSVFIRTIYTALVNAAVIGRGENIYNGMDNSYFK